MSYKSKLFLCEYKSVGKILERGHGNRLYHLSLFYDVMLKS